MTRDRTSLTLAAVAIGAFALLEALEIILREDTITLAEILLDTLEFALTIVAVGGLTLLAGRIQRQREESAVLIRDLEAARAKGEEWRCEASSHLDGLGSATEKQFQAWSLTFAEREVGLLMLKGFSHKEVSVLRGTTESTVRQQARAIYRKANVAGRSAFCAFFLEDLLPPRAIEAFRSGQPIAYTTH